MIRRDSYMSLRVPYEAKVKYLSLPPEKRAVVRDIMVAILMSCDKLSAGNEVSININYKGKEVMINYNSHND